MRCILSSHRLFAARSRWLMLCLVLVVLLAWGSAAVAGPDINNFMFLGQQNWPEIMEFVATKYKVVILSEWHSGTGAYQAGLLKSYNPNLVLLGYPNVRGLLPGAANWPVCDGMHPGVQTTLAADIGPNDTAIQVADGSGFPTVDFYVAVDDEVIEVASRSGNTLTVKAYPSDPQPDKSGRGIATLKDSNWQATSHTAGTPVYWKHEEWFLHDRNDGSRLIYRSYGWYHMDVGSAGWRAEFARHTLSQLSEDMDGAFGDDTWTHIAYAQGTTRFTRVSDGTNGYISQAKVDSFHSDMAGMLADVKQRFGSKLLYFNGLHATLHPYEDYLAAADGGMNEEFLHGAGKPATWLPTYETWQEMLNRLVYTQATDKAILCLNRYYSGVTPSPEMEEQSHMWSLATYLLGSGPKSHFYHDQAGGPYMGYYAVWDAPIGTPTGGYYQADGVYQRDFTNGKVLVNPYEGGAAITVSLSEPLRVLEYDGALSSPVTSVDLSPQHGVVLVLAPLTLTLEVSPSHVAPGAVVTYTITYHNTGTGPADDVSSTVISGDVPEGTTLVPGSVYLNGVQQQPDPPIVDGKIAVDVGTVLRGEEGTVTYEVRLQS